VHSVSCIRLVWLTLLLGLAAPRLEADGKSDFISRFSSVPDTHTQRFYANRKIVVTNKSYKLDVPVLGKIVRTSIDEWKMQMVNDVQGNRKLEVVSSKNKESRLGLTVFFNKDIYYTVTKKDGSFAITEFHLRSNNGILFLGKNSTINQPTLSFNARQSMETILAFLTDSSRAAGSLTIHSVTKATFNDKPAICVTAVLEGSVEDPATKSWVNKKSKEQCYFDEANAHAYLGTIAVTEAGMDYPRTHTRYDLMEYHTPPGETYPLPKRYTRHLEFVGEPKLLDFETDYTSYEKYVPDPEEFKLEKKYGLTTPVGPEGRALVGKPGFSTGGGSRLWLYLLIAGVVLGGLAVHFVRWGRRAKM